MTGGLGERLTRYFALDDPWERPTPPPSRGDWILGLSFLLVGALGLELFRSYVDVPDPKPVWAQYLALVTGTLPLVLRRRHPLPVAGYAALHLFVAGVTVPELAYQLTMQVAYFFAFYSGVAWRGPGSAA